MTSRYLTKPAVAYDFRLVAEVSVPLAKKPPTRPFSVRFTDEELTILSEQAGGRPLGSYIRALVLCERATKRRKMRRPRTDDQQIALVLSALGDSRLSQNLNQLAKHANIGTLEVTQETESALIESCDAILVMRDTLLRALGQRS